MNTNTKPEFFLKTRSEAEEEIWNTIASNLRVAVERVDYEGEYRYRLQPIQAEMPMSMAVGFTGASYKEYCKVSGCEEILKMVADALDAPLGTTVALQVCG